MNALLRIGPAALALLLAAGPAWPSAQLAMEKDCGGCHGTPPRQGVPSFAELAEQYAQHRGDSEAVHRLANQLRRGSLFKHVAAHERLTHEEAEALVRWLIEGAKP